MARWPAEWRVPRYFPGLPIEQTCPEAVSRWGKMLWGAYQELPVRHGKGRLEGLYEEG